MIYERKVVVVLDTCTTEHAQLKAFLDVSVTVINEQLSRVGEFNIICCSHGFEGWKEGLTPVSDENIASAVEWVGHTMPQTTPFQTNVIDGVVKALSHSTAEAIYLLTNGDCTLRAFDSLVEKVRLHPPRY